MFCLNTQFWLAGRCAIKPFNAHVDPSQFNHCSTLIDLLYRSKDTHMSLALFSSKHIFLPQVVIWIVPFCQLHGIANTHHKHANQYYFHQKVFTKPSAISIRQG